MSQEKYHHAVELITIEKSPRSTPTDAWYPQGNHFFEKLDRCHAMARRTELSVFIDDCK